MTGTEQTRIEVLLDGRQASDQLKDLSKNAAALRIELAKAYQANDAGKVAETEWELSKLNTRMKQLRKETVDVQAVLNNLSGATAVHRFGRCPPEQQKYKAELRRME